MEEERKHLLLNQLPGDEIDRKEAGSYIKNLLRKQLPATDQKDLDKELKWSFVLDKRGKGNKHKPKRKRKTFLTRKERETSNLLKLSKTGWNYEALNDIREMWKEYMRENLELLKVPSITENEYQNLNVLLSKSEFVGAVVEVIRCTCPSTIGLKGTIVLETKNTFQIVTTDSKLKILLKETAVFEIQLDNIKFTVYGKLLITRPAERSVKKIKSLMLPDL